MTEKREKKMRFMKKTTAVFIAFAMVFTMAVPWTMANVSAVENDTGNNQYQTVPGELIVVYEDNRTGEEAAESAVAEIQETAPVEDVETITDSVGKNGEAQLVTFEENDDVEMAAEELEATPGVAYVQENYVYELNEGETMGTSGPNDSLISNQYYLNEWDSSFQNNCGSDIKAAWEVLEPTSSVTVAVLDTGCNVNHEDLAANVDTNNMYNAYNKYSGTGELKDLTDNFGHGTIVSGIIGAAADNGKGIAGVADNCAKILPVNVFKETTVGGKTSYTTDSAILAVAYSYLEDCISKGKVKDLHVINMSLGGYGPTDKVLSGKISSMKKDHNVLTVCAAGNGNTAAAGYPSDDPNCLSVMALDKKGNHSYFTDYNSSKDISAPGVSITSTAKSGSYTNGNDGTSFSAPIVSAAAALLWAENSKLTVDQVVEALENTTNPVNTSSYSNKNYGHGALDVRAALDYINGGTIDNAEITLSQTRFDYDGTEKRPEVTVRIDDETLDENIDYTLSFSSNIAIGTANVTIKGKGSYRGTRTEQFQITPAAISNFRGETVSTSSVKLRWTTDSNVTGYKIYKYSSGTYTLLKTISKKSTSYYTKSSLSAGKTYSYAIRSYKTINKKNYYGPYSDPIEVSTKPAKVTWGKLSSGKTTVDEQTEYYLTAKWTKKTCTGYQVLVATDSKFRNIVEDRNVEPNDTCTTKVSGLTKGKYYYVKVRAYKLFENSTIYGSYSTVKKIKIK